jgi:hypothetical protein
MKVLPNRQAPEEVGISAGNVHSLSDAMAILEGIDAEDLDLSLIRKE